MFRLIHGKGNPTKYDKKSVLPKEEVPYIDLFSSATLGVGPIHYCFHVVDNQIFYLFIPYKYS